MCLEMGSRHVTSGCVGKAKWQSRAGKRSMSMRTATRVASWGVAFAVFTGVIFIVYHYVISSALSSPCANKILEEVTSPDGIYVATLFERNCGATTPYYRVVNLRSAGSKFEAETQDDWIVQAEHQPEIVLRWDDARHLSVRSDWSDESPSPRASWRDVTILREPSN